MKYSHKVRSLFQDGCWLVQWYHVNTRMSFKIYKQKMYGKKYVWILTDSLYEGWIGKLKEGQASCSVDNIRTSAYGHFTLGQKQLRTDNVVTISGRVRGFCKVKKEMKLSQHCSYMYAILVIDVSFNTNWREIPSKNNHFINEIISTSQHSSYIYAV